MRPPDERFASVEALYEAARERRNRTEERTIDTVELRTEAVASDALALRETWDRQPALSNWSFEQLATIAGAPPKYLRTLPAAIASAAINHGLARHGRERQRLFVDQAARSPLAMSASFSGGHVMSPIVKITPNDKDNPPGKLADAELHFTDGELEGLKLIGFSIWERRTGNGRNLTFPARQYAVNGERRSFAAAAQEAAEIKDFTWHDPRHTFAWWLIMKDASLRFVAELLGHRGLRMVMRYAHLSREHLSAEVGLLDSTTAPSPAPTEAWAAKRQKKGQRAPTKGSAASESR